MDVWYLRGHSRHLDTQEFQFSRVLFGQRCQNTCHHIAQQGHHCKVVLDETELDVQADVLVEMARGVMWLGTEDGTDLEDALKDAHENLFIELRTLCEVGGSSEVVQLKDVRPALGRGGNDLGRLYFGKAPRQQGATKSRYRSCPKPQNSASCRMAVCHNCMIQQRCNVRRNLPFVERYGGCLCNRCNHLHVQIVQLDTARCLCLAHHQALNGNHTLNSRSALKQRGYLALIFSHSLQHSPSITDNQKSDSAQLTQ